MAVAKIKLPDGSWTTISIGPKGEPGDDGEPGPPGPQGPEGPRGLPGDASVEYLFTFANPEKEWVVQHNLNTQVLNVQALTFDGDLLEADVDFVDDNTIAIHWYYPLAGAVRVFR